MPRFDWLKKYEPLHVKKGFAGKFEILRADNVKFLSYTAKEWLSPINFLQYTVIYTISGFDSLKVRQKTSISLQSKIKLCLGYSEYFFSRK